MNKLRFVLLVLTVTLATYGGTALAQHEGGSQPSQVEATHGQQPPPSPEAHGPNATPERELSGASEKAAEEGEEHAELRQSAAVKKFGRALGLSPAASYWVFLILNFAVLIAFFYWLLTKKIDLGSAMRNRTAMIQKGMEDARKASEEANARLTAVQARLEKLDAEVAALHSSAEADFSGEEQRIRQAAEEDAKRVVELAGHEIVAATKSARRELKAFAAELAVDLAEKKINVDGATDQALVRNFVEQLAPASRNGKDGQ